MIPTPVDALLLSLSEHATDQQMELLETASVLFIDRCTVVFASKLLFCDEFCAVEKNYDWQFVVALLEDDSIHVTAKMLHANLPESVKMWLTDDPLAWLDISPDGKSFELASYTPHWLRNQGSLLTAVTYRDET